MNVKEGQVLTKVSQYRLERGDRENIDIEVHEVLSGAERHYLAIPIDNLGIRTNIREYQVTGEEPEVALQKLIDRIQDVPKGKLFDKRKVAA